MEKEYDVGTVEEETSTVAEEPEVVKEEEPGDSDDKDGKLHLCACRLVCQITRISVCHRFIHFCRAISTSTNE